VAPLASVLSGLADFLVAFALFVPVMWWWGARPTWTLLALPLLVAFVVLAALVGRALARRPQRPLPRRPPHDPFLTQVWLFVTPVVYPSRIVRSAGS